MQLQSERFSDRFSALFEQEGLMNVKFFVKNKSGVSLANFLEEAAEIQSTIAAGDFKVIDSVDGETLQKRFDAAF
ncbi:hypothetical protein [Sphingomonas sp. HMP6]|uniref:hypothetical protein n=1 Tax=Sphingomonas sp. HMP6 TaxID=1517551 RepID=UPI0015970597|nr:hypothetical protein [Sphingomonas sp. HMP6]BCA60448.1 hypothetical protein HMP06_3217 [Sphingomonas sp. HMP6]